MKPTAAHDELQEALADLTEGSTRESRARVALDRALAELALAIAQHVRARDRVAQAMSVIEAEEKEPAK